MMKKSAIINFLPLYFALVPFHDLIITLIPIRGISFWKEIIVWMMLAWLAFLFFLNTKFSTKFFIRPIIFYTIFISFFLAALSLMISEKQILLRVAGIIKIFGYFPLYIIVPIYAKKKNLWSLWQPLLLVSCILGLLAIAEVFWGLDLSAETSKVDAGSGFRRAMVTVGSPLSFGLLMAICTYLAIYIPNRRGLFKLIGIILPGIGMILSLSRGAWVFLALAILINTFIGKYQSFKLRTTVLFSLLTIFLASVYFVKSPFFQRNMPVKTIQKVSMIFSTKEKGNAMRLLAWNKCIKMIEEKPLFGSGAGTILPSMPSLGYYTRFAPESQWLKFFVEFGIVGTALLAITFILPTNFKVPIYGPLLLALLIEMIWLQSLDSYVINMLFWSILGIIHNDYYNNNLSKKMW